ncbi:MAG: disulfide bond formation protein B [Candidatus Paceibacterota bacterium]
MNLFTDWFNSIAASAVLVGMALIVLYLIAVCFSWVRFFAFLREKLHTYHLWLGFLISTGALISTLIYSQIIAFEPCEFCWWQRVAMYPQVLIFGVALFRRRLEEYVVLIMLSVIGMVLAVIHISIQLRDDTIFCLPGEVSCSTIYITEFGFITMPVMSLTVFTILALIAGNGLYEQRKSARV